jgi:ABC-type Fe3+-siderophore transport system permease subunit
LNLDIRMPMGLMFLVVGAILTVFGALTRSDPMYAEHSLGYNVNLIWGAVLFAVGAIMVLMARKASKKAPAA